MATADILLLSKGEEKILYNLTTEGVRPQYIIKKQRLANATAYLAFNKLQRRGLAYRKKKDKKLLWCRADSKTVRFHLNRSQEMITQEIGARVSPNDRSEIYVRVGKESVKRLVKRILDLPEGSRVSIFQGSEVDSGWMDTFTVEEVMEINKGLSDGKILFESIIPNDYFKKLIPLLGEDWAKSYANRPNTVFSFPSEFNFSRAEFHIYKDLVIIFDMHESIAIEIRNKEVSALLRGIMAFIKDRCEHMDVWHEIKKSVENGT